MAVPFNRIVPAGPELDYIREAIAIGLSGNGRFTQRCQALLEASLGSGRVLLTTSCTAALEMSAILADVGPGDEVILPSYTFTSTANAFVLRGAVPVFVDVRPDTLNIDEALVEAAITPRTKAICVVHYAGVAAALDAIGDIAARHGLALIEDAAQGIGATWRERPLGTFGALAAVSFHETKNVIAGEAGALIVNDPALVERAEIVWEKGTDRVRFKRGMVDKYTWVDVGSSYLPNELTAAFLLAQLEAIPAITARRRRGFEGYHRRLAPLEAAGLLRRPVVPQDCEANGHIYYVLAPDRARCDAWIAGLQAAGINALTHYVPLHSSPAGRRFGRAASTMAVTDRIAETLIRLPLHGGIEDRDVEEVADRLTQLVGETSG
ncbi:MAG: dTDP-4-amino-4,6-dideoxygalactose transaminase [Rhizobiales bacterium]|nr:dTDP-4-amino-4,6-dideoxygalactose transaminase [Hyphomicrobiales bacterium]